MKQPFWGWQPRYMCARSNIPPCDRRRVVDAGGGAFAVVAAAAVAVCLLPAVSGTKLSNVSDLGDELMEGSEPRPVGYSLIDVGESSHDGGPDFDESWSGMSELAESSVSDELVADSRMEFGPVVRQDTHNRRKFVIKAAESDHSGEEHTIFVTVTTRIRSRMRRNPIKFVSVEIAKPRIIVTVYLVLYAPVALLWAAYYYYGERKDAYLSILPLTMCSFVIGFDVVNQSLSLLMRSPLSITSVHALGCIVMCLGHVVFGGRSHPIREHSQGSCERASSGDTKTNNNGDIAFVVVGFFYQWSFISCLFGIYQIFNHFVSMWCTLSERTIFTNLCPVFALALEATVMPAAVRLIPSCQRILALLTMVVGALLFGLQYPSFTDKGVTVVSLMVIFMIPYRLCQRSLLGSRIPVSVTALGSFDSIFLLIPALMISSVEMRRRIGDWELWVQDPSVVLMLILSTLSFTGNHICNLLMLQCSSATNLLIYNNVASFVVVGLGFLMFGDSITSPLVSIGITLNLLGGLWYGLATVSEQRTANQAATHQNEAHRKSSQCSDSSARS